MASRKRQPGRDRRERKRQDKRLMSGVSPQEVRHNQQIAEKAELLYQLLEKAAEYFTHQTGKVGERIDREKNNCCAEIDDPKVAIAVKGGFEKVSLLLRTSLLNSLARLARHVVTNESPVSMEQFATMEVDLEIERWVNTWPDTLLELSSAQANVERASEGLIIEANKGDLDSLVEMFIESINAAIPRWQVDVDVLDNLHHEVSEHLDSVRRTKQNVEQQLTKLAAFVDVIQDGGNQGDQNLLARLHKLKSVVATQEGELVASLELISESKSRLNAKIAEARDVKGALVVLERIRDREEEFVYSTPEIDDNDVARTAELIARQVDSLGEEIRELREQVNGVRPRLSTELDEVISGKNTVSKTDVGSNDQPPVSSVRVTGERVESRQATTPVATMPTFRATSDQQYVLIAVVVMHAYPGGRGLGIKTVCDVAVALDFLENTPTRLKDFKRALHTEAIREDNDKSVRCWGTGKGRYFLYKPTDRGVDAARPYTARLMNDERERIIREFQVEKKAQNRERYGKK